MRRFPLILLFVLVFSIACDSIEKAGNGPENAPVEETRLSSQPKPTATTSLETESLPNPTAEQPTVDLPATPIPQSTAISEITSEPQPTMAAVEPFLGAAACPEHDETSWHGLWNADLGCHYDHTHNDDPFTTLFAERMAAKEQTISYPWQTPNENELKHQGYKYAYNTDPDCSKRLDENDNCLIASLIQMHAIGSQLGITTRFHSYWAIALISDGLNDEPGFVELGGHSDFGILHCPYKEAHCALPSDPPNTNFELMWSHPPYRATSPLAGLERNLINGMITQAWNSGWQPIVGEYYPEPYNLLFEYDFISADAWGAVNPDNPTEVSLVCPTGDCQYNHSTLRVYEIVVRVPEHLAGPDGRVNFVGFTDVKGNIDENCTETGPVCVPLIIENAPIGSATFRLPVSNIPLSAYPDFDVYFNDKTSGWIQYPN